MDIQIFQLNHCLDKHASQRDRMLLVNRFYADSGRLTGAGREW